MIPDRDGELPLSTWLNKKKNHIMLKSLLIQLMHIVDKLMCSPSFNFLTFLCQRNHLLVNYLVLISIGEVMSKCLSLDMVSYTRFFQFILVIKVKLATVVEGDQKAPFSIATTPRCMEGCYSFLGLLHFTLDTYLILLSVMQGGIKYHF